MTELPFVTLYEGVFTQQSHVESYITVYRDDYNEEEINVEVENGEDPAGPIPGRKTLGWLSGLPLAPHLLPIGHFLTHSMIN